MGNKALWVWTWLTLFLGVSLAWAVEAPLFKQERFQGGAWRLRAARVFYDAKARQYTAEGRVEIVQGDRRLTADWAQVSESTKIAASKATSFWFWGRTSFPVRKACLTW
jgi:lipopolysaccharide assembly outer membrane protein LptD (OstA)